MTSTRCSAGWNAVRSTGASSSTTGIRSEDGLGPTGPTVRTWPPSTPLIAKRCNHSLKSSRHGSQTSRSKVTLVLSLLPSGRRRWPTDLTDRADVEVLPRRFYGRVFADHVLAEPFTELGAKGLDPHLRVMCDFWENRSVPRGAFHGNALLVHRQLDNRHPLSASHFVRWLALWIATDG